MSVKSKLVCFSMVLFSVLSLTGMILCYVQGTKKAKNIAVDFSLDKITVDEREPRYKFMPREFSDYICDMCDELGDDSDLAVSLLMKENPTFNPEVVHINDNGTVDLFLWQLNDKYFWTTFKERYWLFDNVELNPKNWKHNTYIALHHIHYLKETLKIEDDIIMAYNCGEGAVMNNRIPQSTLIDYLPDVKNNLYLLRGEK